MALWSLVLGASVIVLVLSAIGLSRRSKSPQTRPADPGSRDHRDAGPRAPGEMPAPAPAPMARAAAPNWNAIGAITGVLGLVVSIIGLFKG